MQHPCSSPILPDINLFHLILQAAFLLVGCWMTPPLPTRPIHSTTWNIYTFHTIRFYVSLLIHAIAMHSFFALVQSPSSEPSLQHLLGWTRMHGTCYAWASATKLLPHFAQLRLALTSSLVLLDSLWFAMFWISKHGTLEVTWLSCWGCLSTLPAEYSWVAGRVDSILH